MGTSAMVKYIIINPAFNAC